MATVSIKIILFVGAGLESSEKNIVPVAAINLHIFLEVSNVHFSKSQKKLHGFYQHLYIRRIVFKYK